MPLTDAAVSAQAICVAACFHADWPLLVVCPSSMMLTWLELLSDWLPPDLLPDPANLVVITSSKVSPLFSLLPWPHPT